MNVTKDQLEPLAATDLVEFRASGIHGYGGFARVRIPAGTRVIEYIGETISKQESLRRCEGNNPYIFSLDEAHDLDGDIPANLARFLNHSCVPNCEAVLEKGRIWINAITEIAPRQELTFNYGYDLTDYREYPCQCGALECAGYMVAEEFYEHVREARERQQTAGPVFNESRAGGPPAR